MIKNIAFYHLITAVWPLGAGAGAGAGAKEPWPPNFNFRIKQGPKVLFQTLGIFLFTDVQKLYGPETLQFFFSILKLSNNLWRLFIFSNYIEEIDHFTLDLLKRLDI